MGLFILKLSGDEEALGALLAVLGGAFATPNVALEPPLRAATRLGRPSRLGVVEEAEEEGEGAQSTDFSHLIEHL